MPLPEHSQLDVAWAAGFFDGEGAVIINRNNSTGQISMWIQAGQKVRAPLDKLAEMFGGTVKQLSGFNGGNYEWRLYSANAVQFLRCIQSYLLVKHLHAEVAIEFYTECCGSQDREKKMEYYWRMQALQHKGQHLRTGANARVA